MLISALVITILFIYALHKLIVSVRTARKQSLSLPPGPLPLPFLGNVHQMDWQNMHLSFDDWKNRYGDIVAAKLFDTQLIVLNSYDMVKEALVNQAENFSARKKLWVITETTEGKPSGYINNDGWVWKDQRRYALHILRDFGLGRALQEDKIDREIHQLFTELDKKIQDESRDLDVVLPLKFAVVNIINNILVGKRFEYGQPEFADLAKRIQENFSDILCQLPMEFIPFLRNFKWLFNQARVDRNRIAMKDHLMNQILEHKEWMKNISQDEAPTDFAYAYLREIQNRKNDPDQSKNTFSDHQLCYCIGDLFIAGFETTATTLSWFFIYMIYNPDIQERMRKEISSLLPGYPCWADRIRLPYCNAVIAEIQRVANIVPMGVFHSNFEDTTIKGYHIPKRSMVVINHWSVMRDERLFRNATAFDPQRFLDMEGHFVDKRDGMIPFSMGKRSCLGEGLARMELFLFCTALIVKYEISAADSGYPSLEPVTTLTLAPQPYEVKLTHVVSVQR